MDMVEFILGFLVGLLIVIVLATIWAWVDNVSESIKYLKNERHTQIEYNKIIEETIRNLCKEVYKEKEHK
jgi:uncharacterized membrane protein required for colicin V production